MSEPLTHVSVHPHRTATLLHDAVLLRDGLRPLPLGLELHYTSLDPFAVRVTLEVEGAQVRWVLSRETLLLARSRRTGTGEVAAWPVPGAADAPPALRIRLGPVEGCAVVETERDVVSEWLDVTARLVPPGEESSHIDWDGFLTGLSDDA
ncbi:SsgA family sporulation/cell division regulator [Streptomyces xanthii]|uniref:SsgA family sporulation/cell division regulator n=1 Tax=Streptomyces xanthii TaxID=2768069 RepID=A0A7H1B1Z9_9ACTN|nr:SsgA family sporulation/cell division regulator [Streptomyces xanthii]QNS02754.1 SsgA family sporulation/cell division regulator [Streptomyces xanthii]